eukprot:1220199-Pyramimonas_sp.AAC.1
MDRAWQPAVALSALLAMGPDAAGAPAAMPASPAALPRRYAMGETTFERQLRTRPSATPPIINDGDFTKCEICLEESAYRDEAWRPQRGHIFHAICWDRVAQAHVGRQLE